MSNQVIFKKPDKMTLISFPVHLACHVNQRGINMQDFKVSADCKDQSSSRFYSASPAYYLYTVAQL